MLTYLKPIFGENGNSYQFQDCVEVIPFGYLTLLKFTQMAEVAQKNYLMTFIIPNNIYLAKAS